MFFKFNKIYYLRIPNGLDFKENSRLVMEGFFGIFFILIFCIIFHCEPIVIKHGNTKNSDKYVCIEMAGFWSVYFHIYCSPYIC